AWAATFFGTLRISAVAVPLNTRLGSAAWTAMLADSATRVLIADPALLGDVAGKLGDLPQLEHVILADGTAPKSLEALQARAPATLPAAPVDDDAMAFWLYTSGTTGGPKAPSTAIEIWSRAGTMGSTCSARQRRIARWPRPSFSSPTLSATRC